MNITLVSFVLISIKQWSKSYSRFDIKYDPLYVIIYYSVIALFLVFFNKNYKIRYFPYLSYHKSN